MPPITTIIAYVFLAFVGIELLINIFSSSAGAFAKILTFIMLGFKLAFFITYLFVTPGVPITWLTWTVIGIDLFFVVVTSCIKEGRAGNLIYVPEIGFMVYLLITAV